MKPSPFRDRADAGRQVAEHLRAFTDRPQTMVLALPRGGVAVGFEVAMALHLPLDVFLVRKLGVPGHEELAMGAIVSGGGRVLNRAVIAALEISPAILEKVAQRESRELQRREVAYRGGRPMPEVAGQAIILVDDGLATGTTMRAAVEALRQQSVEGIIVAVPVAASRACEELRGIADEVLCARTPANFCAVSQWYEHFEQTSDPEVRDLLARAGLNHRPALVPSP